MKRSDFIREAYRRADKAGRIDDEMVIKFYLDMFEDMGMLAPDEIDHDDDCPTYDGEDCHGCVPRTLTRWEPEDD